MFYFKTTVNDEHNVIAKVTNEHLLSMMNKDVHEFVVTCDEAPITHYLAMYFKYRSHSNKIQAKIFARTITKANRNTFGSRLSGTRALLQTKMDGLGTYNSSMIEKALTRGKPRENVVKTSTSKIRTVFGGFIGFTTSSYKSFSQEVNSMLITLTSIRVLYKGNSMIESTRSISRINMGDTRYTCTTNMDTTLVHTTLNTWGKISRVMTSWQEVRDRFATWDDLKNFKKKEGEN